MPHRLSYICSESDHVRTHVCTPHYILEVPMISRCFRGAQPSAKTAEQPTFVDLPATAAAVAKDPAALASMRTLASEIEPLMVPVLELLCGSEASAAAEDSVHDSNAEPPPVMKWKTPASKDMIEALCDSEVLSAWLRTPDGQRALVHTTAADVLAANPDFAVIENAVSSWSACQALLKCTAAGRYFVPVRVVLLRSLAQLAAARAAKRHQECALVVRLPFARKRAPTDPE